MIDLIFHFGSDIIFIRVNGNDVKFSTSVFATQWASIDGLKLDYSGVIREFPDLETESNWKEAAIARFKARITGFKTEEEKADYIIEDLRKCGYVPKFKQKAGFRREAIG